MKYHFNQHVCFHDEDQHEIRGIVKVIEDYDDRTILVIKLDSGGFYRATLLKRPTLLTEEEK